MKIEKLISGLHPLEIKLLLRFEPADEITVPKLVDKLSYNEGQCNQAINWLSGKELIQETERLKRIEYRLTDLGKEQQRSGTVEEQLMKLLREQGPLTIQEIVQKTGLENSDIGTAYGALSKENVLVMDGRKRVAVKEVPDLKRLEMVRDMLDQASEKGVISDDGLDAPKRELLQSLARKRGASRGTFRVVDKESITYRFTEMGIVTKKQLAERGITGEEIGVLTPDMLKTGIWKEKGFRSYNVQVPPQRVLLGRKNPYAEFLERLKDKLVSLGFEEFDGPLTETEFWNSDALYMPQFHSARDIHDVYHLKDPVYAKKIEQPYLDQVAKTHENGWKTKSRGWKYRFDRQFTKRMILRSQGTVLSAKQLPKAKVPGKYFGVVRCFRYDTVDATHLADFYQTEGIVLGENVNLRTLLGLLKMFAEEVAEAKEVQYVPGYFPFTEPSVEVHIKHPVLGWFELGGSGIFRPEVTEPLGVKVPVLAWGLGIDRMAMMSLGLKDIRELFTTDLELIRLRRSR